MRYTYSNATERRARASRLRAACTGTAAALASLPLVCAALVAFPARAAELVLVDQAGCPYCERFEREIAPIWPKTEEGRRAPLRRVDLHAPWPADLAAVERATLTPTFILVEDGEERGRLLGYAGDEHFWALVGELLERLENGATAPPGADPKTPSSTER